MIGLAFLVGAAMTGSAPNLVPNRASATPDYFCTWNIQVYACSYAAVPPTRGLMTEASLFGKDPVQGVFELHPSVRRDLIFVIDDSWDLARWVKS